MGTAHVPISIPADTGLIGGQFHTQYLLVDPFMGLRFSNGGSSMIGGYY